MKKYLSMILFVVIMGTVSIGVLIGADALTKDRIAQNAELTWKSSILTHHGIEHTDANFASVFDESFEVLEAESTNGPIYLYINSENNKASFRFNGQGLWDVIQGVITLEEDFKTIVGITVTKQGETPGLGGVVAEKQYLDKFVGKYFDEMSGISITKTPSAGNEVDAIVGATGTSNAFAGVLNTNYKLYSTLFGYSDALALLMKTVMNQNNVDYTEDNFLDVFESSFTSTTKNQLLLFTNKSNGNVSYSFHTNGFKDPGIDAVITLKEDFQTIVKITVTAQAEGWGASIQNKPEVLAAFEGKKFTPNISIVPEPTQDNEVLDGFGGATTTKRSFEEGLNEVYQVMYSTFKGGN